MTLRNMILALVCLGTLGLIAELLLQGHYESFTQWIPLIVLGIGLVSTIAVARSKSRGTIRVFQGVMAAFVIAGVLGVYFHLKGNVEWELERDPGLALGPLIWKTLSGATPAFAPGALAQLGLLGLVWAYRHPSLEAQAKRSG
jgi:hypothetical protein